LNEKNSYDIDVSNYKTNTSLQNETTLIQEFFSMFVRRLDTK
jgi:hypothetical protein